MFRRALTLAIVFLTSFALSSGPVAAAHPAAGETAPPSLTAATAATQNVTSVNAARPSARRSVTSFGKRWMRAANQRDFKWIRRHSAISRQVGGNGVNIAYLKRVLGDNGRLNFTGCGKGFSGDPSLRDCYDNYLAGVLSVKRQKSGRLIAVYFYVED